MVLTLALPDDAAQLLVAGFDLEQLLLEGVQVLLEAACLRLSRLQRHAQLRPLDLGVGGGRTGPCAPPA